MAPTTEQIQRFASFRTIDLTTFGRRSGLPRRIEIWWFHFDDKFIITGTPGRRDWLANVYADSNVLIHVDGHDLEATAIPVADREFRHGFFTDPQTRWYSTQEQLDRLIALAPMVEIRFD